MSDGEGGAIIAWIDRRSGNDDIYAQRIDGNGNPLWDPAGVPVSTASGHQNTAAMLGVGANTGVAVWQDSRNGNLDIYGTQFTPSNMILNPGFEGKTARWTFVTNGTGSFTTVTPGAVGTRAGRVTLTTSGTSTYLKQTGVILVSGGQYRLKFRAKSSTGKDMNVGIHQDASPYRNYGLIDYIANLGTSWAQYTVTFTARGFTGTVTDGRFRFAFTPYASNGELYYLDDVVLEKLTTPIAGLPVITTQPTDQTRSVGQTAMLSVVATGTGPLSYQWQKMGVNIAGATSASYTTPVLTVADNNTWYRCQVWNSLGWASSDPAKLTVTSGATNVVQNPGFESGTANWGFYTNGVGSFTTVTPGAVGTRAAKVGITTAGTNVQLFQTGVRLESSRTYRLTFRARSTTGHDVAVTIQRNTSPYTSYGLWNRVFNLTNTWGTYTATFTTTGFTGTTTDSRLKFWLAPYDANGDLYYFDEVVLAKVTAGEVANGEEGSEKEAVGEEEGNVPEEYRLEQNYPNPFNPWTTIAYALPEPSRVSLRVYDVLGREVTVLEEGVVDAGYHEVKFDGAGLASGTYFCRFEAYALKTQGWTHAATLKMLLLR